MPTNCVTEIHQLLSKPLSKHAWNFDKTKVAVCTYSEEVIILKKEDSKWIVEDILNEHDQLITGLDWCPVTNKIITCSMDRNAYVWGADGKGKWKPTLAALRISKGATCVSWNADGTKFAAGSSNGAIVVGHFEEENDWWLCKHLKANTENTISSISWHPNGIDILAGSIDGTVLIISGYIKSVDRNASPELTCSYQDKNSVPVHGVAFSNSGKKIAYLTQDAMMTVVDLDKVSKEVISLGELPMLQVKFISDNLIITTGHNYSPIIIGVQKTSGKWSVFDDLSASTSKANVSSSSAFGNAFAKFKSMDDCGVKDPKSSASKKSGHKNTISELSLLKGNDGKVSEVSTSSLDGNLIIWKLENILTTQNFSELTI